MSIEKIKAAAERYQKAISELDVKRQLWHTQTEQFIFDTLMAVQKDIPLDWSVKKIEKVSNLESVELSFNEGLSGLSEEVPPVLKVYKKIGARLVFTQSYNGEVLVISFLPYIQDLTPPTMAVLLDKCDPENIDTAFVMKHIPAFIEKVAIWEGSDEGHHKSPIGFNHR